MSLPSDLVLVRHGQSEGNVVHEYRRQGRQCDVPQSFLDRCSGSWRLTDRGRQQATAAGDWIRRRIGPDFHGHYSSPYLRAAETASLLALPNAAWCLEFYLRERDWDEPDGIPSDAGRARRTHILTTGQGDGFVESLTQLYLRTDAWLERTCREHPGQRIIAVCHHEVMWAFRMRLEGISHERFWEMDRIHHPHTRIHNTQVLHYSRRDPISGQLDDRFKWLYSVLPENPKRSPNCWMEIRLPAYSNIELMALAGRQPQDIE